MNATLPTITRDQAEAGRFFDMRPAFTREVFASRERRVLVDGPLGTGKTRLNLEKLRACCLKYPRTRGILLRSVRKWLTNSALVTWEDKVLEPGLLVPDRIRRENRSEYRFKNGSVVVVAGLDDPQGVFSAEYDVAVLIEAIEISQDTAEKVDGRLRNNRMPYQQLLMDCNPGPPTHWLHHAFDVTKWCRRFPMRHTDNPALYNPDGSRTRFGQQYLAALDDLTGVRGDRLARGKWVQAEGAIYGGWDPRVHVIDSFPIPHYWKRYWSIDFGFTNPLCWAFWAQDPDGRLYLYREIYQTGSLVKDVCEQARALSLGEPEPTDVIADHDPENIAQVERFARVHVTPADKSDKKGGIQQVAERLKTQGDGKPRLFLFRDALAHEPDESLRAAGKPTRTESEFDSYVWDPKLKKGEAPQDKDNHGMDSARYLCRHVDGRPSFTGNPYGTDYGAPDLPDLPGDTFS